MDLAQLNAHIKVKPEFEDVTLKENEGAIVYHFLLQHKGINRTVEIGFEHGRMAAHIIAATQKLHIVIDPHQDKYNYRGLKNIKKCGFYNLLDYREDYSFAVLPKLVEGNVLADFIFIDGDHKFDGVFFDFYYADLILNHKGYILLHDTWMRSTTLLISFIRKNRKDYKEIKTPFRNFVLIQKIDKDRRDGMYFKEFYSFKNTLLHPLIIWMSTGNSNLLKRSLLTIKKLIR